MKTHLWLRSEEKPGEQRVALSPEASKVLIDQGIRVTVEDSPQRCFPISEFKAAGCESAATGAWRDSHDNTIILGLKELGDSDECLRHRHIHFAHVYKNQKGWQSTLNKFAAGGGQLYDLEFLVDDHRKRVAAFGYWAGFVGAAIALKAWARQQSGHFPVLDPIKSFQSKDLLVRDTLGDMDKVSSTPTVQVIGAKGRSGAGAVELARECGADVLEWDIEQTSAGGPFLEILDANILINCVLIQSPLPPFLTTELIQLENRTLSVICDVSCDPYGLHNPLPIYSEVTTFADPAVRLVSHPELDLISIDHLPSMLPRESSEDFVAQLLPHLLGIEDMHSGVWGRALTVFNEKSAEAAQLGSNY